MNAEDLKAISTDGNDADSATARAAFIAKEAGVSLTTIYKRAKELGRLPTVTEAKAKRAGRKPKYK